MNTLNGRRLISFVGMTILLGAVAFMAYGASIDCTDQRICVGTEADDSITLGDQSTSTSSTDRIVTRTIKGLGGDDNIVVRNQGTRTSTTGSNDSLQEIFGGAGDDRIQFFGSGTSTTSTGNTRNVAIFGEDGDDFIEIGGGDSTTTSGGSSGSVTVNSGRGDDTIIVRAEDGTTTTTSADSQNSVLMDGEGRDTILVEDRANQTTTSTNTRSSGLTIHLSSDNEADTVRGSKDVNETIILDRDSGRDVLSCGDELTDNQTSTTSDQQSNGMIILNGNRKATDPFGNNLFRAAREGGTAQTNCDTVLP